MRQGQLKPGDRLPPERDLCERFGVSRVTVREALRMLESSGLVQIRVGARGGAFVTAPSSDRVGEGLTDMLTLSAISAADVTEIRLILEMGIVPLVCERATEQDIADLEEICERSEAALRSGEYPMEYSLEFHTRVARATHNPAVVMLVESFRGPIHMSLEQAREVAPLVSTNASSKRFAGATRTPRHRSCGSTSSARPAASGTDPQVRDEFGAEQ
jgi:DNA-binding FadR family transcriptional regulator